MKDIKHQGPHQNGEDEDEDKGGTSGGSSGEIEFHYHDVLSEEPRDDMLSQEEINRLLASHKDIHKVRVDKQKNTRKERKMLKEGPVNLTSRKAYVAGMAAIGGGAYSKYKTHPIAVKFSGIRDQKISAIPSENTAETNQELKHELENRNENKLRLNYQPGFNPKPKPF
jgi:hypothetical protein